MKKQTKINIGITAGVLLVAVIVIVTVLMASGSDSKKYARHMESAQRYMDELQYEQAIAEYKAAIEIEPNNTEAYRALAELYVQTGDYESAIAVLNRGMEQTGSEELAEYIEEVQAAYEEEKVLAKASVQEEEPVVEEPQEQDAQQEGMQDLQKTEEGNGAREETEYLDDGSYFVMKYDENGNCVQSFWYNADGTLNDYTISEYDENGNVLKLTDYNADGILDYSVIFEYDENGNNVKSSEYNADGTLDHYIIFEYDINMNRVKDTYYSADGTIYSYLVYEHDDQGYLVKSTAYNADGSVSEVFEY